MSKSKKPTNLPEHLQPIAEELWAPINFDALINSGILEKHGAYYKVNDQKTFLTT
jgi:hypothetical protein